MTQLSRLLLVLALLGAGCATMSPQETALRELMWHAATGCATGTAITVTDIDSYGRVHYSTRGMSEVPQFTACYSQRSREELAKRPDLAEYLKKQQPK